jgi:hypothetical protein
MSSTARSEDRMAARSGRFCPGAAGAGLDAQQLLLVVPLVQRPGFVQPLVALQPDEPPPAGAGDGLGQLGLAYPGGALDEYGLGQVFGKKDGIGGGFVGHVARRQQRVRHRPGAGKELMHTKETP